MSTLVYFFIMVLILPFRTEQCEESSSSYSSSRSSSSSSFSRSRSTSGKPGVETETPTDMITQIRETTPPATSTDTPTTVVQPTFSPFCVSVFQAIGPFCQLVVEADGECLRDISESTCDSCRNITAICGFFDGDICLTSLASTCTSVLQPNMFLEDYCRLVLRNCTGLPVIPVRGQVLAARKRAADGSGDGATTLPLPATLPPPPLVNLQSLTEQQKQNVVTIAFTGISVEQFVEDGLVAFQEEMAAIVNTQSSTSQRVKRQQAPVSSNDVIVLDSPFMSEGRLLVLFVVGGRRDQSEPVSESVLTNWLLTEGPRLATALTIAIKAPVQFAQVAVFTSPTPIPPTQPSTQPEPAGTDSSTTGSLPSEQVQEEGLPEHIIVAIVLSGLLVIMVGAMVLIGFAVYSGIKTVKHDPKDVKLSVARSTNLIAIETAIGSPTAAELEEGKGGLESNRQSKLSLNVIGTTATDSVAMTTTSVSVDVHPTGEQSTTL